LRRLSALREYGSRGIATAADSPGPGLITGILLPLRDKREAAVAGEDQLVDLSHPAMADRRLPAAVAAAFTRRRTLREGSEAGSGRGSRRR
jgi:hypothetical protein